MRRLLICILCCAMLAAPFAVLADITQLRPGDEGTAVELLQMKLMEKGFYTFPQITGYYGAETESAVVSFQRSAKLGGDGIAGKYTLEALFGGKLASVMKNATLEAGSPSLAKGAKLADYASKEEQNQNQNQNQNQTAANNSSANQTTVKSGTTSGSGTGSDIVNSAMQYLGYKYVYATAGPDTFDCSGLTKYVFAMYGITLPHTSRLQGDMGTYVSFDSLKAGDMVFFDTIAGNGIQYDHVGIYIGGGQFIHAASSTSGVIISSITSGYYKNTFVLGRRMI